MDRKIVAITGPTAVGKTEYAIHIAENLDGEIVSCDSMQIYKYMDIGSAKPSPEELARVKHYLVDVIDPREEFSVAKYQEMAKEAIETIFAKGKLPVICGGTGLYLDSLLYDLKFGPEEKSAKFRYELERFAEANGSEALHDRLKNCDPEAAERIPHQNVRRVIRAIEAAEYYGEKLIDFAEAEKKVTKDYDVILISLTRERAELYERINERVDRLMEAGLLEEIYELKGMGFTAESISMKGIGYKELLDFTDGKCDLKTAVDDIKKNTRHFAKRQMTWFRRYDNAKYFDLSRESVTPEEIEKWLQKKI